MNTYFAQLPGRCVVAVLGDDAEAFLQAVISQNVEDLDQLRYGLLLTPQGKLLYDFLIYPAAIIGEQGVLLDCAAQIADALIARLTLYKLRRVVDIKLLPFHIGVIWNEPAAPINSDDLPKGFMIDPRHSRLGARALIADDNPLDLPDSISIATSEQWRRHRIMLKIPEGADEMPPEDIFPLEFGLDTRNAIDFQKGCYIGQEVVSRIHRRAKQARKTLMLIAFADAAPPPSTPLMLDTRNCGAIYAQEGAYALALIRTDVDASLLTADGAHFERIEDAS